ncbi:M48 family metalloprotease [Sporosarcina soli]|uniref:M48 family metalloprotease n=1 Tax=Sporosarcina soli TaxID=334736 RepID=A0ABW0TQ28_9BACL
MNDLCKKHPEIAAMRSEFCFKLNFNYQPKIKSNRNSKIATGFATVSKSIVLNKRLLNELNSRPEVVKAVLAHEFIHLKYMDPRANLKRLFTPRGWLIVSKESMAICLLHEIRANIEGYALTDFPREMIKEIEMYLKAVNGNKDKESQYKLGYPSREQAAQYAQNYKIMTKQIAVEVLDDYCDLRKILNKSVFIDKCIKLVSI